MSSTCPWTNNVEGKSEARASKDRVGSGVKGVLHSKQCEVIEKQEN